MNSPYDESRAHRAPPPGNASAEDVPIEFYNALKRTPRGLKTKGRLEEMFVGGGTAIKKKLAVDLVGKPPPGDRGDTQDLYDRIVITIDVDPTMTDRMLGWSRDEILNVVGVHEAVHLIKINDIFVDNCGCRFGSCHVPHFESELASRIQYSLIHPAESAGKAGWLQRYIGYFAAAKVMAGDTKYQEMCAAGKFPPSRKQMLQFKDYEAAHPADVKEQDLAYGAAAVFDIYKAAVTDMKNSATAFRSEGLYDDDLKAYKAVLADYDKYQADSTFALLLP